MGREKTNDDCDINGVQRQSRARFDSFKNGRSDGIIPIPEHIGKKMVSIL